MKITINLFEKCDHRDADKQRECSKDWYRRHKKQAFFNVKRYARKNKKWTQERKRQWRIKKLTS